MNKIIPENIKAILFDAGHTLNYPAAGHWFVPPAYEDFFKKELAAQYVYNDFDQAFKAGDTYLADNHFIQTEAEEYNQFRTFFKIFFRELNSHQVTEKFLSELAHDIVFNDKKFAFYDDVFDVLPQLADDYLLGIVSDTWPSLERVFVNLGLRSHFSTFVISSKLGITKPHPGIFQAALDEMNIASHDAIFIDDSIENLNGARDVGLFPILIDRENRNRTPTEFPKIADLNELIPLLSEKRTG